MAVKLSRKQTSYGYPNPQANLFPDPVVINRAPTGADQGEIGQEWIDTSANGVYFLTSIANGQSVWTSSSGGAGVFSSLVVTPGPITLIGTTHINSAGTATTNIGNATGNTAIAGTLNVSGTISTTDGSIEAGNDDVGVNSSVFQVLKSRGGGVITSGDDLGSLIFAGFDGTGYETAAVISSTSSGTIGAGRVAGNLAFYTHPDAATPATLRMNISAAGNIAMAQADSGNTLTVSGATNAIFASTGDITIGTGDLNINTAGQGINLPGPIQIITGAGVPANGLALHAGDIYCNTTPTGATDRIFVATGVGAWTNVTCAA